VRYRPYESYYQPDVDWLDEMPSHWEVRRAKTMLSLQKSKVGRAASEHVLLSLTLGGVVPRDISEGGKFPAEFDTYQIVEPEDLVFCLFDIDETPRTIGIARDDGMITGAYSVYRAHGPCVPEYACYYFLHLDSFKGLRPFYTGLRKVVRADTFSKVEIPAPPLEEQTQIAKFLDYETLRIDALIEKQQQLITLLKEKRQAVISHAVTKGLNPDTPMRDSGVEWLGEVPAHWEFKSIKRLFRQEKRQGFTEREVLSVYREFGVILKSSRADNHNKTPDDVSAYQLVNVDDLVINKMKAWQGSLGISPHEGITSPDYIVYAPLHQEAPRFIHHLLRASHMPRVYLSVSNGIRPSQWRLEPNKFENLLVPLPPIDEQHEITNYLDKTAGRVDDLIEAAGVQVTLLQERRTALISAAVTGKIDVRGWKAPKTAVEAETA
jgi:type I restriction enzyme, S subunit